MRIVVYTAITQGYDTLKEPPPTWRRAANFVAFMEDPGSAATTWEFRPICREFGDPCRNAKIHKILSHEYFPEADYSLWIDGTINILSTLPLAEWPEQYLKNHDLAVFKHCAQNCAYKEAKLCMMGHLDDPVVIERQMQRYFEQGYPMNNGLAECSVLFRRHTPQIKKLNECWWEEIRNHSRRDQLSFNFVAYQLGVTYFQLPGQLKFKGRAGGNPHFQKSRHTAHHSQPR